MLGLRPNRCEGGEDAAGRRGAEAHAAQLEHIVSFGMRNAVNNSGDVPTVLDQFQRVLDDYEEATGDPGINDSTKKTIMMQLLPASPKIAP